tara:strand:+ start:1471 stop:2394 length:924 start_codon:yes stop_codon:yes gene_type:complete
MKDSSKTIIITFSDNKYFSLLKDLILSIKRFPQSKDISIGILDGGLDDDQIEYLKQHTSFIKKSEWDIKVDSSRIRGRDYLKNGVNRAFLPKYFPEFDKYIWLDCDTWINDWIGIDFLIKGCDDGKLGVVPSIAPGYRDIGRVNWIFKSFASVKTQNYKHAISSGFSNDIAKKIAFAPHLNAGVFSLEKKSKFWDRWRDLLNKAVSKGRIFASEQIAMNIAVYYEGLEAEFLPPTCNWIVDHLFPYFDEEKNCFVEPFLPNNKIGVIHLASKIKGDENNIKSAEETIFDIKTLSKKIIKKSLRYTHN